MTVSDSSVSLPGLPPSPVPARALYISLLALAVPFAASGVIPGTQAEDLGMLVWVFALIPAFLLSYYRGWKGSAVALAGAMAALALTYDALYLLGLQEPRMEWVFAAVVAFLLLSIGLGIVTELLHRARRAAEADALTDALTGLANRRYMEVYLEGAVTATRLAGAPLSAVVFDLDRFKWLNDTHGHAAGDEVLRRFARLLAERKQDGWLFARSGGEEFTAVLPHVDWEAAYLVAEEVREDLQDLELRWKPVTLSAGVATLTPEMSDWKPLLAEADSALYRAKELGRDRVEVGQGRTVGAGVTLQNPHLGPDDWTPSRGIVVLPDVAARRPIRRALELNGLNAEEWESPEDVPIDLGAGGPIAVVVTAVDSVDEVVSSARAIDRATGTPVPKLVFAPDHVRRAFRSAPEPGVQFVEGDLTGERVLAALPRVLHGTVVKGAGNQSNGRARSALGMSGTALTDGLVVVADDERSNRLAMQRTLDELGFRNVTAVASGKELLGFTREAEPDLLLLDLHMPEMDGFQVLEALDPELNGGNYLPVLVVTGDHNWETRQRALRMGARDFLNKPFDVAELGARVLNLLETRQLHLKLADTNRLLEGRVRQRTWELERAKDEILTRLARAAEYRDDVTGKHADRVGEASRIIAEEVGLSGSECDQLRRAAPLHDIGKIAIPDAILMKPGPLTASEFEVMKRHTTIGAELLKDSTSEAIHAARVIALTHHERWDGSGYPRALVGADIPLFGRIVALADAMDALTHVRPYKHAIPFENAVELLRRDGGTAFDPTVMAAFEGALDRLCELMTCHD